MFHVYYIFLGLEYRGYKEHMLECRGTEYTLHRLEYRGYKEHM